MHDAGVEGRQNPVLFVAGIVLGPKQVWPVLLVLIVRTEATRERIQTVNRSELA